LVAILMAVVVNFFLSASPASAFNNDTMPHYGDANPCSNGGHMVNNTHTGTGSYTFRLCKAFSNAQYWKAQLIDVVTLIPLTTCGLAKEVTINDKTFTCAANAIPTGTYLASLTYWIPGSNPTHAHYYYVKP